MELYYILATIAALIAIIAAFYALGKIVWRFFRRLAQFFEDWFGEEARPGVPKRCGVMERLDNQDRQLGDIQTRLTKVEVELSPNTGKSMKDAVHRSDKRLAKIEKHLGMEDDV